MALFRRFVAPTVALAALLVTPVAHAGGFNVARFGGEYGIPTTDLPVAIYYNPAGLALGTGTRLYVEGLIAWRTASYDRPAGAVDNILQPGDTGPGTPADAIDGNTGKATLANLVASPFLGVASDLGVDNLGVGLAFFAPFGGQASWDETGDLAGDPSYPGAIDGPARWSTIEGEIRALYFSAGGSYYLPGPRLSFGVSVSLVRQQINTIRARTAAGTDNLVSGTDILEGRSQIDVAGNSLAAGVGVMWQPVDDLWLGASYQSQPGFGETAQRGELTNKFGPSSASITEIDVLQSLPDVYRLGARARVSPAVELRLSGDFQRWSVMDNQCLIDATIADASCNINSDGTMSADSVGVVVNIPRRWHNTFGVKAGASYWLSSNLELNGGASFDSSAVPDDTLDPSLMDMNKMIAGLGVVWTAMPGTLRVTALINNVFYFKRTTEPRVRDADGNADGFQAPSRVPDFAGKYKQNVIFGNIGVEYAF
jgi:long-chain fatty acid transport protein